MTYKIPDKNTLKTKLLILLIIKIIILIIIFIQPPIYQDQAYHFFADNRYILGIQNFMDVLSNLFFLIFGFIGFKNKISASWKIFFLGILLVAPGSAYYHYDPNDQTLVWDRLPMTMAFMGLIVAMLETHISLQWKNSLIPMLLLGFSSVIVWVQTGDLRLYYFVQLSAILIIPLTICLFPNPKYAKKWLLFAFICYVMAKIFETYDKEIYEAFSYKLSGHSLKHLAASLAPIFISKMLSEKAKTLKT
jgi:hypothetical protein